MTNHPYKLLVVDVDGTLLDRHGAISAADREALAGVSDSGIRVSLSTGRAAKACSSILGRLSLDGYHVFFDGALVGNPGQNEEIYVRPIDEVMVRQAIEFAYQHDLDLELHSSTHYFVERETWSSDAHRRFFGIQPTIVKFTRLWNQERIIKGGLVATSPQEAEKVREFCLHFSDSLHFSWAKTPAYPGVDFINILAPEVSKGKALEALAAYLGITLAEVMAIGDGVNDIPLLATAGLAVAMGDAPDEVRKVADHITLDVEHNGVAEAVKRFLV